MFDGFHYDFGHGKGTGQGVKVDNNSPDSLMKVKDKLLDDYRITLEGEDDDDYDPIS